MRPWLAILIAVAAGTWAAIMVQWSPQMCCGILVAHVIYRACRQTPELDAVMKAIRSTDQIESSVIVSNLRVIDTHLADIRNQLEAIRDRRPSNPKVN